MPRTDSLLTQLQREIADLRSQVKTLQSAPRLRHVSLDDAAIPVKGADGRVKQVIGRQSDGSFGDRVVESGPQPIPTAPILDPGAGAISVEWDGGVVSGEVPRIFGRVEVMAAPLIDGVSPGTADPRHVSSIYSAQGGATTIKATSGDWMVWLRMVGADGRTVSDLSEPVVTSVADTVDERTLRQRIESALVGDLEDGLYDSLASRIARFIELEAESIKAYHLAFDALDGQVITGSTFQTHKAEDRGVKWTDEGVVAYSDEGRVTLWLDGERNRLAGTFRMEGSGEAGDIAIQDFRAEELFTTFPDPDEIYSGIGFEDVHGDSYPAGIFVSPRKTLTLTTGIGGRGRPDAWMSGGWRIQRIRPSDVLEPENDCRVGSHPVAVPLINGWRTGETWGDEAPGFVRFGNMIFLRGSIRTPSGGHMGTPIFGHLLPVPSRRRRLATIRALNTGASAEPTLLEVDTRGWFTVVNGSSITDDRLINLDGLIYYL